MTGNFERYQRIAPLYDLLDLPFERARYQRLRPLVFEGLGGRILEVGVGTGRNLPYYPAAASVVGVDLSPRMLARAQRRRPLSPAEVELRRMDATRLDFPDATFDAAVATFLFCVLPDPQQLPALRELARVVRPGGAIRLLDYVRPRGAARRLLARLWEPWISRAYGARFDRDTEGLLPAAGLRVDELRFVVGDLVRLVRAHVRAHVAASSSDR